MLGLQSDTSSYIIIINFVYLNIGYYHKCFFYYSGAPGKHISSLCTVSLDAVDDMILTGIKSNNHDHETSGKSHTIMFTIVSFFNGN